MIKPARWWVGVTLLACGGSGGDVAGPSAPTQSRLDHVDVTPSATSVTAGATTQFVATPKASDGTALSGLVATWSSDDTTIVKIDAGEGLATGVKPGNTSIHAIVTGIKGSATISVTSTTITLAKLSTDPPPTPVGQALAVPLQVKVTDGFGNGRAGLPVTWTASAGTLSAASTQTDNAGTAQISWTLGTVAGPQSVTASVVNTTSVQFNEAAQPGPAASLTKISSDPANVVVGTAAAPLSVRAVDAYGNPVSGVPVTWVASAGSVSTTATTTDATGAAQTTWTMGTITSMQTLSAKVAGTTLTAQYSTTARAAAATKIVKVSADPVPTVVGQEAFGLSVRALDAFGNAVTGATIAWSTSQGIVSTAASITDATGAAQAAWTMPTVAGVAALQATLQGTASTVQFSGIVIPGSPALFINVAGSGQSGVVGTILPTNLTATVTDQYGNVIADAPLTWTSIASAPTTATLHSAANGQAIATLKLSTIAGTDTVYLASGSAHTLFTVVAIPDAPASLTVVVEGQLRFGYPVSPQCVAESSGKYLCTGTVTTSQAQGQPWTMSAGVGDPASLCMAATARDAYGNVINDPTAYSWTTYSGGFTGSNSCGNVAASGQRNTMLRASQFVAAVILAPIRRSLQQAYSGRVATFGNNAQNSGNSTAIVSIGSLQFVILVQWG